MDAAGPALPDPLRAETLHVDDIDVDCDLWPLDPEAPSASQSMPAAGEEQPGIEGLRRRREAAAPISGPVVSGNLVQLGLDNLHKAPPYHNVPSSDGQSGTRTPSDGMAPTVLDHFFARIRQLERTRSLAYQTGEQTQVTTLRASLR